MSNIKLFESKQIRTVWNESDQKWYFVVEDVVAVLTIHKTDASKRRGACPRVGIICTHPWGENCWRLTKNGVCQCPRAFENNSVYSIA
jgi:prophage antirepressor-like protein